MPGNKRHSLLAAAVVAAVCGSSCHKESHGPAAPPETVAALATQLRADVTVLAEDIGARHLGRGDTLVAAETWIASRLRESGYLVEREAFSAAGEEAANLIAEIAGAGAAADEVILVGAHYDTAGGTPGADDNGSGVAVLLALAQRFADSGAARTVRFMAFANEEPPFFQTDRMGSLVHARNCRAGGENIVAMLALETLGYYSDEPGSQKYPPILAWLYPSSGNFVAVVGDRGSGRLVKRVATSFRRNSDFPCEAASLPASLPGIGWSDHWSFWQEGYPAVMLTDTAPFRYPHYHEQSDTPEKLDYDRLARVTLGLEAVVRDLAAAE